MAAAKKNTPANPVDLAFGETETISADDLRDLIHEVTGRDLDSKTIRARLRKIQARDQKALKGAKWSITRTLAESEIDHYAKKRSEKTA